MTTAFFMPMKPPTVTHQEKKISTRGRRPIVYESAELKDARAKFRAHLSGHVPDVPYTKPVTLCVTWCFPVTGCHYNGEPKTTKPDTDNLIKLLKDVMTECGFWKDDAIVFREISEKFYCDLPGVRIYVSD